MKKIVLKAEIDCEKCKRKKFEAIAGVEGVHTVTIDADEKRVTVIGDVDPARLAMELRRFGWVEILSVGPAKDDKKEVVNTNKNEKKDPAVKTEDLKAKPKKMAESAENNMYLWTSPTPYNNMPYNNMQGNWSHYNSMPYNDMQGNWGHYNNMPYNDMHGNWSHYDEHILNEENYSTCSIC